ncbi:MAG: phage N-6-adenine-methyltransferase [Candidatus Methanoplasma sp.]|nr:phage N-6-adenine-methyltransferase [Candidatus Methanoplasma sp.]
MTPSNYISSASVGNRTLSDYSDIGVPLTVTRGSDEWATPQHIFDALDREFHFSTDLCASDRNFKCPLYFTKETDSLKQAWTGICFMNPPYSRTLLPLFVEKAYRSARDGAAVVSLLPVRADTGWWHDYVLNASEIRFIRKRVKFGDCRKSAPFSSAIVIFGPSESPVIRSVIL